MYEYIIVMYIFFRLADVFMGRLKLLCTMFITTSVISTFWVLLLVMHYIEFSLGKIFIYLLFTYYLVSVPLTLSKEMSTAGTRYYLQGLMSGHCYYFIHFEEILLCLASFIFYDCAIIFNIGLMPCK